MKTKEIIKILNDNHVHIPTGATYKELKVIHKEWKDWDNTYKMIEYGKNYFAEIESGIKDITHVEWCKMKYIKSIIEFVPHIVSKEKLTDSEIRKVYRLYNLYNDVDYNDPMDFSFVMEELIKIYRKNK